MRQFAVLFVILLWPLACRSVADTERQPSTQPSTTPYPTQTPYPTYTSLPPQATYTPEPTHTPQPIAFFFASDQEGAGALYYQDHDGEVTRLTDPAQISAWEPAIDPWKESLLFTGRREGQSDIALMPAKGGAVRWLTEHPADDYAPAWDWGGRQIAWVSERGNRPQVWIQSLDSGEEPQPLPGIHGERRTRGPAWEPAGTLLFSALDEDGLEELYRYDRQSGEVEQLTFWPMKASQPAVSATGNIVFVGWEERPPWRGLYLLGEGGEPQLLWETTEWIGEPVWSRGRGWIFFTRWRNDGGGHDLWALPASGGEPQRVSNAPSWEGHAAPWDDYANAVPSVVPSPPAQATFSAPLALGFNVANLDNAYLSHDLGFGWAKGFADWERIETERGVFRWIDVDNTVQRTEEMGLRLLLRVDRAPTWARPPDVTGSHPPSDLEAYARFWEILATRYRGRVAAYELWNEPNLSLEWGNQRPDPAYYVEMLRVAHATLQRVDPDALLIVGALAVTGEGNERAMGDLAWMQGFYEALGNADPRPYDAFSTHPYGFGQPPEFPVEAGLGLRRLEAQRALMEAWGDFSPLWLTELGYPRRTPGWSLGEHEHWVVSDEAQAQYLVGTLDWVEAHYPFVEAVFFFNLDFSTVDWYSADEQMRAYAILDSARAPLPAYSALRRRWVAR